MGLGLWLRTGVLMAFLTGLLMALGYVLGSETGMIFAFIFALAMNFFSYWYSDKIVLTWYRARIVDEMEAPELHRIVEDLAREAGIPKPRVAIVPTDVPNAFATGRDPKHAVVAVTQGLLRILDRDELEGVLAHEISHIRNRDILIQTLAAVMAGAIIMIARWAGWMLWLGGFGGRDREGESGSILGAIVLIILAPIAAMMIQMAISRAREYLADESGAKISGKPWALARALEKIEYYVSRRPLRDGNPATAHMFIINPFRGVSLAELFSTHPPTQKRIERLRKIAEEMGMYF
ncbi:zinc metalloprotease HtpX [Thermococcus barophilus]|uniref:Protease HtpX homolog n=2 Tax=Thermococcus barophilus TaxID=55802 RepID=A0A0S1X9V0_THEBA|nr:zinc metalloprotease HtpX [Thermococcus barophilus]ADT83550.1 peptidase precursor [Thermococcus barophilus MP]ALM74565.1 Protease [Thermococcus barophilus]